MRQPLGLRLECVRVRSRPPATTSGYMYLKALVASCPLVSQHELMLSNWGN